MSDYRLTTSFPYLVRRVGIRIGELFDERIAHLGITVSMYRVLAALKDTEGQTLGGLGTMTSIEISTLSRLVGAMRRKGLLTRQRPVDNGRIVAISLTPKGRELADQLTPIAEQFEAVALAGLPAADVARVKSLLVTAFGNLDRLEVKAEGSAPPPGARQARGRRAYGPGEGKPLRPLGAAERSRATDKRVRRGRA